MTSNSDAGILTSRMRPAIAVSTRLLPWLALAAIFVAAVLLRRVLAASTDVSWLLIAAERLIDGQQLYSDIIETNPPMAVLTYVPGVLIGRAIGIRAEIVTDGLVFVAIAIALAVVWRILRNSSALETSPHWLLMILAAAVLAILPTQTFGQREHIAVIELLPALALLALRARAERPAFWAVVVAGVGMGLSLAFKPYFALAVMGCIAVPVYLTRNWRVIFAPENFIAAAVVTIYAVGTWVLFPDYFTIIGPLARDVYVPIGLPMMAMLEKPVMPLWGILIVAAIWLGRKTNNAAHLILIAASIGFAVVFLLQRKGWPYHSYPMVAFAVLAFCYAIFAKDKPAAYRPTTIAALAVLLIGLFAQSMIWFNRAFDARPLVAAVARLGPHPKILAISGEAGIGHPLTRAVGGTWVSRQQQTLFVAGYNAFLHEIGLPEPPVMNGYLARERSWLIADFRKGKPDIVLVDHLTGDWGGLMRNDPELMALMGDYRLSETVMDIDVYSRQAD